MTMGGLLLSVLVKLGSKGTWSIKDKLASSTCGKHQLLCQQLHLQMRII